MTQLTQIHEHQSAQATSTHPLNVMLEISARCPQRCPFCPLQGSDLRLARSEGLMSVDLFRRVVDQLAENPPDVVCLHASGESTIHPEFARLGVYARTKLPETRLRMNTGGLLWTTKVKRTAWLSIGIDRLVFSIEACRWLQDGLDRDGKPFDTRTQRADVRDDYKRFVIHPYRAGAPWALVVPNIIATARLLRHLQRDEPADHPVQRVKLGIQHAVTREQDVIEQTPLGPQQRGLSTWEIEFSRAFWAQHGIIVNHVAVATVGGQVDNADMVNAEFTRKPMGVCREVYTNLIVAYDGRVSPCCVDSHELELLPDLNLHDMTIAEVWAHPSVAQLRKQHRSGGGYPAKCERCLKSI